jgi:hypothetical protein
MIRKIIIREVSADEELRDEKSNRQVVIFFRAGHLENFFARRELLSQKIFFRLTPSFISFTQHGLFCARPNLN